ncbi:stage II sporulation protein M [Rhizomonospora bruguierae]|uniref:stage II sporulation protein M n=1 Tax=Rhizomonospora bruguierae TaxID=1581705 RepID=UPI001BCFF473|nr:stage II sporulation protein M [Micromonospora sp. NBRC 107566]
MDLDAFVAEHDGEWRRLERLSRHRRLSATEADELVALYQRAATHLSAVRSRSPDPVLVARLSRLVLAGRGAITGGSRFRWRQVGRFFTAGFPLAAYRAWPWWSGVAAATILLTGFLMSWIATHPESARAFLTEEQMDRLVNTDFAGYYSEYLAPNFSFLVWTHNAWVLAMCLASGVLIAPVLYLLWENSLNLAIAGGVMLASGREDVFFGLILPHGLLELTCMFVCAGVGLRIGWAWIAPGADRSRGRAVAQTGRTAMLVALGLVPVLLVSALLEAFVTPSALPTAIRIGIGAAAWLAFLGYVLILGRRAAQAGHDADADT